MLARGLPDDGIYKVLPEDFAPMPLPQLAAEIEQEHGIAAEIIQVNDFVSSEDIINSAGPDILAEVEAERNRKTGRLQRLSKKARAKKRKNKKKR